jgi:SPBc2 prophage-derived thioredoxin-like protein yosR
MKKLIKFEKENCKPCEFVTQYLNSKGVEFEAINAYNDPMRASKMKVRSVPTLMLIDTEGNEIKRIVGYNPQEIDLMIEELKGE